MSKTDSAAKPDLVALALQVAKEVMGCRVVHCRDGTYKLVVPGSFDRIDYVEREGAWAACPQYFTDIAADYEVLKMARGWRHKRREAFCQALRDIWGERCGGTTGYPSVFGILYEPGDYSRAALKALEVDNGD